MKKYFAMIAMMLPMAVMAQEEKDTTVAITQVERQIMIAAELSKYGYLYDDALSLVQAARLSKEANFICEDCAKVAKEKLHVSSTSTSEKKGQVSLDPTKLLTDAKSLAGNDGVLLALIDDVNRNVRGAVGGAIYSKSQVEAHDYDIYDITFKAGKFASVIVVGDGDTDLDVYVYDNNGNLIAKSTDYSDTCICTWTPRWTGSFHIKIINRGDVFNRYIFSTN